jgi:hypothetical protein
MDFRFLILKPGQRFYEYRQTLVWRQATHEKEKPTRVKAETLPPIFQRLTGRITIEIERIS